MTRELRQFSGKFSSVIDLKVKLMEQFENQLPITLTFNIGYYDGRQSEKRWICDKEDLEAMYSSPALLGRTYCCGVMDAQKIVILITLERKELGVTVFLQDVMTEKRKLMTL